MRRSACLLLLVMIGLCAPTRAQIGKNVIIQAGTPEDQALLEITNTADPAQKLALIEKFLTDYGKGDMAVVAYEQFVNYYLAAKNYDKVFEYGDKLFGVDPDNFANGVNMVRAAQEKGDAAKLFDYGERLGGIVSRFKGQAPPEGMSESDWAQKKQRALEDAKDNLTYVEQSVFVTAYRTQDTSAKAGLLARFAKAFPDSSYANQALGIAAATYQQAQNTQKMLEVANALLAKDPDNLGMLILLADHYSEKGEQLDKADAYAKKALGLLETAKRPEGVTDEQWQQQTSIQKGLALTSLGQININRKRDAQAVENFKAAAPLLRLDAFTYARNQYRMGFALLNLKRTTEARAALAEAASINSPYRTLAQDKLKTLPPAPAGRKKS